MGYKSTVVLAPGATNKKADEDGHGTAMSANLFAIAPNITFIGVKIAGQNQASILEAFNIARMHQPDIISMSLGYDIGNISGTNIPNG
ncbi:MAG: peptidase S8, partial [Gammaproteobacteria bacterium]|nr:peptidase S8 [Gammaproteobacteria bacterium]